MTSAGLGHNLGRLEETLVRPLPGSIDSNQVFPPPLKPVTPSRRLGYWAYAASVISTAMMANGHLVNQIAASVRSSRVSCPDRMSILR
jgi:hypothetical protein